MTTHEALIYALEKMRGNLLHPGFIWTPMVEQFAAILSGGIRAVRSQLDAKHSLGHIGKPDDIEWAVIYLVF